MREILRVFGILALFGMLAASLGPANAAQIQLNTGAPYLCAVVAGGSTAPGTPVIAYSCSAGPEDQWNFAIGNIYGIGSTFELPGMCLDIATTGLTVVMSTCVRRAAVACPHLALEPWGTHGPL